MKPIFVRELASPKEACDNIFAESRNYPFFPAHVVYVKFFGTHADYDDIDALTVDDFSDV